MSSSPPNPNPYIGPRPFDNTPADIARFFGRAREARDIFSLIIAQRVVLVYGQSGTGKTSLLNAALMPLMQAKGLDILPTARVRGSADTQPGGNIYIDNTLASWHVEPAGQHTTIGEFLAARPHPLNKFEEPALRVCIFDQFEELFTAYPERWSERSGFFDQIEELLEADRLLRVVFLMREDFLGELEPYTSRVTGSISARYRLERLRVQAAVEAVTAPLKDSSRRFAPRAAEQLVDELRSIQTAQGGEMQAGQPRQPKQRRIFDEFIEPVVLQVVCETFWNSLPGSVTTISTTDVETYASVGNALGRFYEDCVKRVSRERRIRESTLRDWCENKLITPAKTRNYIYSGERDTAGLPNDSVEMLESLHLIRSELRSGGRYYELVHDRFIDPILSSSKTGYRLRQHLWQRVRPIVIPLVIISVLVAVIAGIFSLWFNAQIAPYSGAIAALASYEPQFQTARILAADGSVIAELNSALGGARTNISLGNMSPFIIHAVVSVENPSFFDDPGFDPVSTARFVLQNLTSGAVESGASTITQQIARNFVLQDVNVSPNRKLLEILVAAEISRRYDKNFILELYLNEMFFGNQSYGVEAASQFYFGHSAADLNLVESALLAGLIQAPATYDPVVNRQNAFNRMDDVLSIMGSVGCLQFQHSPYSQLPFCVSSSDFNSPQFVLQKARVESAPYTPRQQTVRYPHFVNYVQQIIEQDFGSDEMYRRGFEIRTTLVPRLQDTAQTALQQQVSSLSANGINTGAVMVTDPRDGAIRAMVGSPNFNNENIDGQVNNAFTWQQPGTAITPVVYAAALEGVDSEGVRSYFTPATILWDVPVSYDDPPYSPVNYDRQFHGPVALRYALANSYNIPAVKTYAFIGSDKFIDTAQRMGLHFLPGVTFGLPSALGANEVRLYDMMQMYGTVADNGVRVPLYAITAITTADGQDIVLPAQTPPEQAIQPQIAFLLQSMLSDNNARFAAYGANSPLNINDYAGQVAAKTGTSGDNRDLWTMGFSRDLVVGVWIGRHDGAPTVNISGLAAAPIWNAVMTTALQQGAQPGAFPVPQGIVQQQVCAETGSLFDANNPTPGCRSVRTEYFVANSPPTSQSFVQTLAVDTWTGLRANQFCPDNLETRTFANITDASAVAWLNTPVGQAYAQSIGLPTNIQAAPESECDQNTANPQVRFTNLADGQQVSGLLQIQGIVTAPNFQSFQLELAPAYAPDSWQIIAGPFKVQQPGGTLATWDTTGVPNGLYVLRLVVSSDSGGYASRSVRVGINAIVPTATATVQPTETATLNTGIELDPIWQTATAITQNEPTTEPTSALDPLLQTATALVFSATQAAAVPMTETAAAVFAPTQSTRAAAPTMPPAPDVEPIWQTATAFLNGATATAPANPVAVAGVSLEPIWQTATAIYVEQVAAETAAGTAALVEFGLPLTPTPPQEDRYLTLDTPLHGSLVDPPDYWFFTAKQGETVTICVLADKPANGLSSKLLADAGVFDPVLSVVDGATGESLAYADDIETGVQTDAALTITFPHDGTYILYVSSYQNLTGGDYQIVIESNSAALEGMTPTCSTT